MKEAMKPLQYVWKVCTCTFVPVYNSQVYLFDRWLFYHFAAICSWYKKRLNISHITTQEHWIASQNKYWLHPKYSINGASLWISKTHIILRTETYVELYTSFLFQSQTFLPSTNLVIVFPQTKTSSKFVEISKNYKNSSNWMVLCFCRNSETKRLKKHNMNVSRGCPLAKVSGNNKIKCIFWTSILLDKIETFQLYLGCTTWNI